MQLNNKPSTATVLGRGVLAGLAGTVVMTAFQKLVEMPLTQREDSYAPADFAEKLLLATRAAHSRCVASPRGELDPLGSSMQPGAARAVGARPA